MFYCPCGKMGMKTIHSNYLEMHFDMKSQQIQFSERPTSHPKLHPWSLSFVFPINYCSFLIMVLEGVEDWMWQLEIPDLVGGLEHLFIFTYIGNNHPN